MERIIITRVFNAPKEKIWQAWTTLEQVQKWWGPAHFTAPSIKIDFRVGGKYIYAMHGPAGSEWDKDMYSAGIYREIVPNEKIVVTDYFSDENGNKTAPTEHGLSPDMPAEMEVVTKFEEIEPIKTKLSIEYTSKSEKEYEVMKQTRMEEGWGTSLDKLAKVVESA